MKQKHTDHSRQFLVWLNDLVKQVKRDPTKKLVRRGEIADLIQQGTKFLLPGNGIILDDKYLRGINETIRLSLPYPIIVLEFPDAWNDLSKTIITAVQEETEILMYVTVFNMKQEKWGTMSPVRFNRDAYIERNDKGQPDLLYSFHDSVPDELKINHEVYHPYIAVFLQFLNAMSCKNVSAERSPPSKVKNQIRKNPIPYDEYKILTTFVTQRDQTTGGSGNSNGSGERTGAIHASPREHLRRGHIVRMGNGKGVYWRNATIVMAGNGGRIEKAYLVK